MSALHIFDMDGTLLRDSTASLEISHRRDQVAELEDLETRFAASEITAVDFALAIRELWHDLTDDPAGILTPADKVRFVETERARRHLPVRACVAYGDSLSDEPLFAALDHTVAINADARLETSARIAYRGDDLREAYAQGRELLEDH